jgi:hypothetical protein
MGTVRSVTSTSPVVVNTSVFDAVRTMISAEISLGLVPVLAGGHEDGDDALDARAGAEQVGVELDVAGAARAAQQVGVERVDEGGAPLGTEQEERGDRTPRAAPGQLIEEEVLAALIRGAPEGVEVQGVEPRLVGAATPAVVVLAGREERWR